MRTYTIPFDETSEHLWLCGPKAMNLVKLVRAGYKVPGGFAITFEALDYVIATNDKQQQLNELLERLDSTEINHGLAQEVRDLIQTCDLPKDLLTEITNAYTQLKAAAVSVRSSSNLEDTGNRSFAGQHDTFLNIVNEGQLIDRIKSVWASAYTDRAVSYLKVLKISQRQTRMGVVVQQMVEADVSGVAFSIHPVTGDREQLTIFASYGLGETTVSGTVTPDEVVLNKETLETDTYIAGDKSSMLISKSGGGLEEIIPEQSLQNDRAMTETQLQDLGKIVKDIELLMQGNPQDVEWALKDGHIYLLQARPLVVKTSSVIVSWESPVPGAHWRRNWRLGEWIPDAITPLFASWILPGMVASREEFGTGALGWEDMDSFSMPKPWFCIVNGYFYTRQDFPQQLMVQTSLEERLARMMKSKDRIERWKNESLPAYVEHFENDLRARDVKTATSQELFSLVQQLVNEAGEFWSFIAPIGYGFEEMVFSPIYEKVIEGDKPHYSILFAGYKSRLMDAQVELWQMAERIKLDEPLRLYLDALDVNEVDLDGDHRLPGWLVTSIQDFDETYGHQVLSLDVYWKTLGEMPAQTLRSIKALSASMIENPLESLRKIQSRRDQAVNEVLSRLDDSPTKQKQLADTISFYQGNAAVRENCNFYLQIGWPLIRKSIKELAGRLVKENILTDESQIYFIEKEELFGCFQDLQAGEPHSNLSLIADARKKTWEEQRQLKAPDALSDDVATEKHAEVSLGWNQKSGEMKAIGVSHGTVTGKVRIVVTDADARDFVEGEVLVIKAASPLFTPLMLLASGLVVEVGGGASHSSLVAREIGLPAVANAEHATDIFRNGQEISVDGATGMVRLVKG